MPNYNYITTHNALGQAVFSTKIPPERSTSSRTEIYSSPFKPDLSTETDIDSFSQTHEHGHPPGKICSDDGVSTCIVTIPGNDKEWRGSRMVSRGSWYCKAQAEAEV